MTSFRTRDTLGSNCDSAALLQDHQAQMRDLLRHCAQDMERQFSRQLYLFEHALSEQSTVIQELLDKNILRDGASAERDGAGRSPASPCPTAPRKPPEENSPTSERSSESLQCSSASSKPPPSQGERRGPSLEGRASLDGRVASNTLSTDSSWRSITRVTARQKIRTANAYKDAQEAVGDTQNLPPCLTETVNSVKSWRNEFLDDATETCAERFVRSRFFQCSISVLIVANAVFIGSVADLDVRAAIGDSEHGTSRRAELNERMLAIDVFFTAALGIEQLLRIYALQWKFLVGRDCCWNLLDISLLFSSVVEIVGQSRRSGCELRQAPPPPSNAASDPGGASDDHLPQAASVAPRHARLRPCALLGGLGASPHHLRFRSALSAGCRAVFGTGFTH